MDRRPGMSDLPFSEIENSYFHQIIKVRTNFYTFKYTKVL